MALFKIERFRGSDVVAIDEDVVKEKLSDSLKKSEQDVEVSRKRKLKEADSDKSFSDVEALKPLKKRKKQKLKNDTSYSFAEESVITNGLNESVQDINDTSGVKDDELLLEANQKKKKQKLKKSKKMKDAGKDESALDRVKEEPVIESADEKVLDNETTENAESINNGVSESNTPGFQILGSHKRQKIKKVYRVLPDWLSRPHVISGDVKSATTDLEDPSIRLNERLIRLLKDGGVTHLFPVQAEIIPELLNSSSTTAGYQYSYDGSRPQDICCSSPTGSGKTLAFVLPIIQILQKRVTRSVRCLIVEPVSDLAVQVHRIFKQYAAGTDLKIGLLTGIRTFALEQASIVRRGICGWESRVDILVCTPGRLVDHINRTSGFDLSHLRFLVIDEADRVMDEVKQDWLSHVEKAVYCSQALAAEGISADSTQKSLIRSLPPLLTAKNYSRPVIPLQKLLFSATLSHDPEKLDQLKLFQPKLFTVVSSKKIVKTDTSIQEASAADISKLSSEDENENNLQFKEENETSIIGTNENPKTEAEYAGKYLTPVGLKERFVECTLSDKPLMLLYLLRELKLNQVLCFTNSVDSTHRLCHLLNHVGGIVAREFSSALHVVRRARIIRQFSAGKINMLVCSDAMARGMDVDNVGTVISYDLPQFIKTYVHRIGRTARAGREGLAISLLEKREIYHFKQMLHASGKVDIKEIKVRPSQLKPYTEPIEKALKRLPDILQAEKSVTR